MLIFLILVPAFLNINISAQTVDDDDTQFWNETTLDFPFSADNKKIRGLVIGNLRVTDNISNLTDKRLGFGVIYKASKLISITPSYIFRTQTDPVKPIQYEHRIRLDITPKKTFGKFTVENRNRFEHRFKTAKRDDETFYRNQTKVSIPFTKNDKTYFTPFVYNDTYFDLQNPQIHRNDTGGGISRKFSKNLTTEFFYQYRRNFDSRQKIVNIVGINLKFKVD